MIALVTSSPDLLAEGRLAASNRLRLCHRRLGFYVDALATTSSNSASHDSQCRSLRPKTDEIVIWIADQGETTGGRIDFLLSTAERATSPDHLLD